MYLLLLLKAKYNIKILFIHLGNTLYKKYNITKEIFVALKLFVAVGLVAL